MFLVSNATGSRERQRRSNEYPPDFGGPDHRDQFYVQSTKWSILQAQRNWLSNTGQPDILLLCSEDVLEMDRLVAEVKQLTASRVLAVHISLTTTSPGFENKTDGFTTCFPDYDWSIGYLNMGYFFVKTMWELPLVRDYDFIVRHDSDLAITSTFPCNPFDVMNAENLDFMYYKALDDPEPCTRGQKDLAMAWATTKGLQTESAIAKLNSGVAYWGALGIFRTRFWLSEPVQAMLRMYADNGGLYRHRWTDQSTTPWVLTANGAIYRDMGGFSITHAMNAGVQERWTDQSYCDVLNARIALTATPSPRAPSRRPRGLLHRQPSALPSAERISIPAPAWEKWGSGISRRSRRKIG